LFKERAQQEEYSPPYRNVTFGFRVVRTEKETSVGYVPFPGVPGGDGGTVKFWFRF